MSSFKTWGRKLHVEITPPELCVLLFVGRVQETAFKRSLDLKNSYPCGIWRNHSLIDGKTVGDTEGPKKVELQTVFSGSAKLV